MRKLGLLLAFLCALVVPAAAQQVDTTIVRQTDSVQVWRGPLPIGCYRDVLISESEAVLNPHVFCWQVSVASVAIAPSSANLLPGQTAQFTATPQDSNGWALVRPVTWTTGAPTVATVDAFGLVTAVGGGSTTVIATSDGKFTQALVTVTVPVAFVTVAPATATLMVNQNLPLVASTLDANNVALTGRPVTWTSSLTSVAAVNTSGVVVGISTGTTTVSATAEGKTGSTTVTVIPVPVATVAVTPNLLDILVGQTYQLAATTLDSTGATLNGRPVAWTSNNASATVTGSGLVTAVSAGTATVTATAEGKSKSIQVTVRAVVTPPPGNLAFHSYWPIAGTTYDVVHDSAKWNGQLCDPANPGNAALVSVPAAGTFMWKYDGQTHHCYMLHTSGKFTAPKVGESAFYQFYYYNGMPNGQDLGQVHWLQASSIQSWEWKTGTASNGTYALRFIFLNYANQPYPAVSNLNNYLRGLSINTTYRVEMRLRRVAQNTAKVDFRVADGTGHLLYTTKDFVNDDGRPMTQMNADLFVNDADFHTFELGNNDANVTGVGFMATADFSVRISADTSAWIGVVAPPVTGVIPAWFSDWHTATGQTTTAIRDGAKWDNQSGTGTTWLTVVAAAGKSFPADMVNVLQVNVPGSSISQMLMVSGGKWATPAVGSTIYYRVYHRSAFPNNFDNGGYHPLQNGLSNLAWEWKTGVVGAGSIQLEWWNAPGGDYPYTHFDIAAGRYLVNRTYRIEWAFTRLTTTTAVADIRVYDEAGTLVFTSNDFLGQDGAASLGVSKRPFNLNNVDAAFQQLNLGNNGPSVGTRTGNNFEYYGGFAVCLTAWCGPYSATKG